MGKDVDEGRCLSGTPSPKKLFDNKKEQLLNHSFTIMLSINNNLRICST